ncbi:hypothetical protein P8452_75507 [Trifolium repens]|nr:hypothetical protein P8452_75507 [Trifolium repens]
MCRSCNTVTCGKCNGMGHNMRSCKGKRAADRDMPKGGNKEKKAKKDSNGKEKTTGPNAPKTKKESKTKEATKAKKGENGPTEIGQGSQAPLATQE